MSRARNIREDEEEEGLGGRQPRGAAAVQWHCRRTSQEPGSTESPPCWSGYEGLCRGYLAGNDESLSGNPKVGAARNDKQLYGGWVFLV